MVKVVRRPLRDKHGRDFATGKVLSTPVVIETQEWKKKKKRIDERILSTKRVDGKVHVEWLGRVDNFISSIKQ